MPSLDYKSSFNDFVFSKEWQNMTGPSQVLVESKTYYKFNSLLFFYFCYSLVPNSQVLDDLKYEDHLKYEEKLIDKISKSTKPKIPNQNYQPKSTKPNLPNQTY